MGAAAILLGGCVVQSIHPLFTEKEYIPYPALVGTWAQHDDKGGEVESWKFEADGKQYKLTQLDEKGNMATFHVAAGQLGTNVFLDFSLDNPSPRHELNGYAQAELVPVQVFVKVTKVGGNLVFTAMDVEWLAKHLEQNPKAIAHVIRDKAPMLTASTEELQKFVAKHANDNQAFKNEVKLYPKKTNP